MNEKQKRKLGHSMRTLRETQAGVPWYRSMAWQKRKDAIAARLKKAHEHTAARKAERMKEAAV